MIKNIYYRGIIDFCNYSCSYCPFSKKKSDKKKLEKEEKSLENLFDFVKKYNDKVNIMITPYGEALVYSLYQKYISRLSTLENVNKIGIQTNLSLDVGEFLDLSLKERADLSKIALWSTYHDEFADIDEFSRKANELSKKVSVSCGIVANTKNYDLIKKLRDKLSVDIYLWVNALDKLKNSFNKELINKISQIDPMFFYEFGRYREEFHITRQDKFDKCISYDNIYIDNNIYSSNCFFKKKKSISNSCNNHNMCDCYLGYSNFEDNSLKRFFSDNIIFRIPKKRRYKAVFIDIDGTMTDKDGKFYDNIQSVFENLYKKSNLYIATARSFLSARKKLGKYFKYFKGGVFSDGCYTVDFDINYKNIIEIDEKLSENIIKEINNVQKENNMKEVFFRYDKLNDEKILRIYTSQKFKMKIEQLQERIYGNKVYFQNKKASKYNGILNIIKQNNISSNEILVVSDNIQDKELFEKFIYTASPLRQENLSKLSCYSTNISHLPMIIR